MLGKLGGGRAVLECGGVQAPAETEGAGAVRLVEIAVAEAEGGLSRELKVGRLSKEPQQIRL